MGFAKKGVILNNSVQVVYDGNLLVFGLLMSKMHNIWVRQTAGRLESRFRYSAFLCYNAFPFPRLTERQKNAIIDLAKEILLIRAGHSEMTLGDMYSPDGFPKDLSPFL